MSDAGEKARKDYRDDPESAEVDAVRSPINTPDEALERLAPSEWVLDANDQPWCLVNTHVMFEQIMWKSGTSPLRYVALDGIPYPIHEAKIVTEGFECPHKRVQERGHCERCGQIVGDTEAWKNREYGFGLPPGLTEAQRVALLDQVGAAIREHFPVPSDGEGQADA